MKFKLLLKEINNRCENFYNGSFIDNNLFSIKDFACIYSKNNNYVEWSNSGNSLFIKSSNFFNGPNIILGDGISCNEFFKVNNFNSINYLIYSLNPKSLVILDDKRTFLKYKKENYIDSFYLNLFCRLLFLENFDLPKFFLKSIFFIQIYLNILLLILIRPSSIIVTDISKYWKLIIAAKILKIKNFLYLNELIMPEDQKFILEFINKFQNSIPESAIYSSRYIFSQVCGLNLEKSFSNYLLNTFKSNDKFLIKNKNQIISIIGFINNFNQYTLEESFQIASFIINKLKKEYPRNNLNFLPISNQDYKLLNLLKQKFNIINDFEKLLNSKEIYSFYLNGSIQLYESFEISSTVITINNKYKNYVEALCNNIFGFNILNIDQKKLK